MSHRPFQIMNPECASGSHIEQAMPHSLGNVPEKKGMLQVHADSRACAAWAMLVRRMQKGN